MTIPAAIEQLCDELIAIGEVERVVLGGSRAAGTARPMSDWDIGVHYRGDPGFDPVTARGELHAPGSWGPVMNGGAWLDLDGTKVDVLLRDLDAVERWTALAEQGSYDVVHLLGYVAGVPTYSLAAELSIAQVLRGDAVEAQVMSAALSANGARRWRLHRDFSLRYAEDLERRSDIALTAAHLVKACLEEAHARHCEERRWVLNEKGLLKSAALSEAGGRARAADVGGVRVALGG